MNITANADGSIGLSGKRWIRVEDNVFVREDGTGHIAFRTDNAGAVTHVCCEWPLVIRHTPLIHHAIEQSFR